MPQRTGACRRPTTLAVVVLVLLAALVAAPPAGAEAPGPYLPPVDGAVVDPWRPPGHAYGSGNRGVDLHAAPGDDVRASAAGEVTFAGQVGGSLHVTVAHADGLRTSYSFLASVAVRRGERVARGAVVGTADGAVHFGVRADDRYLDPTLLLAGAVPDVHLVPSREALTPSAAEERRWLAELAASGASAVRAVGGSVAGAAVAAGGGLVEAAAAAVSLVGPAGPPVSWLVEQVAELADLGAHLRSLRDLADVFRRDQVDCTPPHRDPPPPPPGRRIAVLVGGFGSSGRDAAILDLDTASLGYAPSDVVQFSYRGGRVPGIGALGSIPTSDYGPADASGDLRIAADRLHELLATLAVTHPGVPVDVLAHSQGGLVARRALAAGGGREVASLVTLGTPHDGTDLATAGVRLRRTATGQLASKLARAVTGGGFDPGSVAVGQLAEGSAYVTDLVELRVPTHLRVVSVAARGDLVVPALHSAWDAASNAVVPLAGLHAHGALPSDPGVAREVALGLAGLGPTCRDVDADLRLAATISLAEDGLGRALHVGAVALDAAHGLPGPVLGSPVP